MVLGRPGVASKMGFAIYGTTAADILPFGITPLAELLQNLYNFLIVGLVVCYKYWIISYFSAAASLASRRA